VGTAAFWGIQAGVTGNIQAVMSTATQRVKEQKMSDEHRLLSAIRTNPDSDEPRLAYARWLESRDASQAELIRVQCELDATPEDF
jgi:uncharacterized protein (TIGR02996 family)